MEPPCCPWNAGSGCDLGGALGAGDRCSWKGWVSSGHRAPEGHWRAPASHTLPRQASSGCLLCSSCQEPAWVGVVGVQSFSRQGPHILPLQLLGRQPWFDSEEDSSGLTQILPLPRNPPAGAQRCRHGEAGHLLSRSASPSKSPLSHRAKQQLDGRSMAYPTLTTASDQASLVWGHSAAWAWPVLQEGMASLWPTAARCGTVHE